MDAETVLSTARSGVMPDHWHAWPLRKDFVLRSAIMWTIAGVPLLAIFALVVSATVPHNFQQGGAGAAIFTILILVIAGMAAFGSLGIALYDVWRALNADRYLLVMTPEDYVKAEPRSITHVPMEYIAHVTLRGIKTADLLAVEEASARERGTAPVARPVVPAMLGGGALLAGASRRRMRAQSPTLAFLDTRTNKEVVVGSDASFDELSALEYVLKLEIYENERRRNARS